MSRCGRSLSISCNQIAESCGFEGLGFVKDSIVDHDISDIDVLIALHACEPAQRTMLFSREYPQTASIIVAAPAVTKRSGTDIKPPEVLRDILKHGSMLEREAEDDH
jgi:hypothetical protein